MSERVWSLQCVFRCACYRDVAAPLWGSQSPELWLTRQLPLGAANLFIGVHPLLRCTTWPAVALAAPAQ